jgi:predicted nucleic acid-binding protein
VIVVSDTTPISELAKINRLTLLRDVYQRVIIPNEVYDEVMAGPGAIQAAVQAASWLDVVTVRDSHAVLAVHVATRLGLGECAALILADELGAQRLLMDDRAGRREAKARGLHVTGTIGTLLVAKQRGIIPSIRDVLDDLRAHGTRISEQLYRDAIGAAGE